MPVLHCFVNCLLCSCSENMCNFHIVLMPWDLSGLSYFIKGIIIMVICKVLAKWQCNETKVQSMGVYILLHSWCWTKFFVIKKLNNQLFMFWCIAAVVTRAEGALCFLGSWNKISIRVDGSFMIGHGGWGVYVKEMYSCYTHSVLMATCFINGDKGDLEFWKSLAIVKNILPQS